MVSFVYDDLGNHLTQDDNGTTTVGLFNAVNEQTKRGVNDILYDSRGNLTKDDSGKAYFYDRQNMLTRVDNAQGGQIMRYAYDAFNRLIERDEGGAYAMQYDYDGWRRLEECPSDDPGAHRTFVWTPGSAGYIDDLLACVSSPGTTRYACHNHNFSVVALLTSGGGVFERYDYNPYGERLVLDPDYAADADGLSDISNPVGFQGLFHDDEAGLIYVRNRYLNTKFRTWMTRDPLEYVDGVNMYQYTSSNPIRKLDASGLSSFDFALKLGPVGKPFHGPMNVFITPDERIHHASTRAHG